MRVVLAHGHIFKNAGTTFDWSLARNFGEGFLDHREDKLMRQRGPQLLRELLEAQPGLQAISSHHLCQPPQDIPDLRFQSAWFVRHPLARIDSVYTFERQQESDSPGAIAARSLDFSDYVGWRMEANVARTIRDYQTFYIAGMPKNEARTPLSCSSLRVAIANLEAAGCVGVVDRYDESMVVFEEALSADFPDIDLAYIRQNASLDRVADQALRIESVLSRLGGLAAQVLANNSYDLALYRVANQKLDHAIAAIIDFPERLQHFQARCADL